MLFIFSVSCIWHYSCRSNRWSITEGRSETIDKNSRHCFTAGSLHHRFHRLHLQPMDYGALSSGWSDDQNPERCLRFLPNLCVSIRIRLQFISEITPFGRLQKVRFRFAQRIDCRIQGLPRQGTECYSDSVAQIDHAPSEKSL